MNSTKTMTKLPTPGDRVIAEEYPNKLYTASINPNTISFQDVETEHVLTIPHSVVEAGLESGAFEFQAPE